MGTGEEGDYIPIAIGRLYTYYNREIMYLSLLGDYAPITIARLYTYCYREIIHLSLLGDYVPIAIGRLCTYRYTVTTRMTPASLISLVDVKHHERKKNQIYFNKSVFGKVRRRQKHKKGY